MLSTSQTIVDTQTLQPGQSLLHLLDYPPVVKALNSQIANQKQLSPLSGLLLGQQTSEEQLGCPNLAVSAGTAGTADIAIFLSSTGLIGIRYFFNAAGRGHPI